MVGVGVKVGVLVSVAVAVAVGVGVAVGVPVAIGVGVEVGLFVSAAWSRLAKSAATMSFFERFVVSTSPNPCTNWSLFGLPNTAANSGRLVIHRAMASPTIRALLASVRAPLTLGTLPFLLAFDCISHHRRPRPPLSQRYDYFMIIGT